MSHKITSLKIKYVAVLVFEEKTAVEIAKEVTNNSFYDGYHPINSIDTLKKYL